MTDPITAIHPGSGRREQPRSHLESDAAALDLCGTWRFRWSPTPASAASGAQAPSDDDSAWDELPVPSHWVLERPGQWGTPAYTNVVYPFPVEPPFVPDANPTGDHRRSFDVPDGFVPDGGRAVLRFGGVESLAVVWLNGVEVGVVRGSRLPQELDVTAELRTGSNLLHVRVHQWSAMSYIEDQDQWWLPGIFREVTVLARPASGLDDVWLRADYDPATGEGTLSPEVRGAFPVWIRCPELGLDACLTEPVDRLDVGEVDPWSADQPRLYHVEVTNAEETVRLRVGFRRVEIKGDAWLVNGRRLRLRGVNRHEFSPRTGRVWDAEQARADLITMKRHNLNAIRTSHYPPHPELLALADEFGFWVIDECDLETHGFELVGWAGNPSDDPAWRDCLLDRVERMVERDKNHPCIVAWSLGNEAGTGRNLAAMSEWIHQRDPGRGVHYEGDHAGDYTDLNSRMYPPIEELEDLCAGIGDNRSGVPGTAAKLLGRPLVLCEYVHAMGNGAGGIADYERVFDASPMIAGGFVWEWRDHGLDVRTAGGTPYSAYGGDFGEEIHDGSFVCDGMTLADATPTPMLAEYAAVVSPIKLDLAVGAEGSTTLIVTNLRHAGDTSDLEFAWTHETDGHPVATGLLEISAVEPGDSSTITLPGVDESAPGEHWLGVEARLCVPTPWAEAGHVIARTQALIGEADAPAIAAEPPERARFLVPAGGDGSDRPARFPTSVTEPPVPATPAGHAADQPSRFVTSDGGRSVDYPPRFLRDREESPSDYPPRFLRNDDDGTGAEARNASAASVASEGDSPVSNDVGVRPAAFRRAAATVSVGEAAFDARTGALLSVGGLELGSPQVTLWRAPTENDSLATFGSYELADPVVTRGRGVPGPPSADRWRAIGLDRLQARVVAVDPGANSLTVRQRLAPAGHTRALNAVLRWSWADGLRLDLTAEPEGDWPTTWPRAGVHLRLPAGYERAAWFGTGPAENYPDSRAAARTGRFEAAIDDLGVRYAVPQETGHRAALRELVVTGAGLPPLGVVSTPVAGRRPGFTLSRYSAQELTAARHPHELPAPSATHLYLDAFQHGLGSRSCGPDVRPECALWPRPFALSVTFVV